MRTPRSVALPAASIRGRSVGVFDPLGGPFLAPRTPVGLSAAPPARSIRAGSRSSAPQGGCSFFLGAPNEKLQSSSFSLVTPRLPLGAPRKKPGVRSFLLGAFSFLLGASSFPLRVSSFLLGASRFFLRRSSFLLGVPSKKSGSAAGISCYDGVDHPNRVPLRLGRALPSAYAAEPRRQFLPQAIQPLVAIRHAQHGIAFQRDVHQIAAQRGFVVVAAFGEAFAAD